MMQVILLLVVLSWPWQAEWLPNVLNIGIIWREVGSSPCHPEGVACYDSRLGAMHVWPNPANWGGYSLEDIVFHELQHHLQFTSGMWEENRWEEFRADVADFYLYGHYEYSDHQRVTLRTHMEDTDKLFELHAELPFILNGEIPCSLQKWYPWFDLGEHCELEIKNAYP